MFPAFINFTNIASAIKAIDAVKNREPYSGLRVSYGCVDGRCLSSTWLTTRRFQEGPLRQCSSHPIHCAISRQRWPLSIRSYYGRRRSFSLAIDPGS